MQQIIEIKPLENCNEIQRDFPILQEKVNGKRLIYLDNTATTQKPDVVIDAMNEYYKKGNANVHRGVHLLAQRATEAYERAHEIVALFINASFEEVIFTKGTTESINLLAYSLAHTLQKGDEIVLSEMEHHSNIVPWQQVAKWKGAKIKYIPLTTDFRLDMEKAKELITEKTRIVSVAHMSNVLGTINPVKELANFAHNVGALMIVDAAQSVPHLHVDVKDLDCDFLCFSGHKMLGPTGIGVLYGKKEHLETMEPFLFGGDMISEVTYEDATWNDLPWKFEAGTPNIAEAVGLAKAIEYLQKIGMENIRAHDIYLTSYALEQLTKINRVTIIGPKDTENRGAIISFTVENIHPHDLAEILNRHGIAVRGGHHCAMPLHQKLGLTGTTRASFYVYNTKEDIDTMITAIQEAQEIFK